MSKVYNNCYSCELLSILYFCTEATTEGLLKDYNKGCYYSD